jgi:diguanylate cyclase (GGDEF)-like protein/PAS domain S-box-containing protein
MQIWWQKIFWLWQCYAHKPPNNTMFSKRKRFLRQKEMGNHWKNTIKLKLQSLGRSLQAAVNCNFRFLGNKLFSSPTKSKNIPHFPWLKTANGQSKHWRRLWQTWFADSNVPEDFQHPLFNNNPAFLAAIDKSGKLLAMNDTMLQKLGYSRQEVIGKDYLSNFVPEQDREALARIFQKLTQEQETTLNCNRVLTKNGRELLVQWHGKPIYDPQRQQVPYFFGIGIDITEKERAEDEVHLLQKIIRQASTTNNWYETLEVSLRLICEFTGWDFGEAWLPTRGGQKLAYATAWYRGHKNASATPHDPQMWENLANFHRISNKFCFLPGQGLPGRVWVSQQPEWIRNVSAASPQVFHRQAIAWKCDFKASFGVPVLENGQVLAILVFFTVSDQQEDRRLLKLISSVALQLGGVFQRQQAEANYRHIFENAVEGIFQTTIDGRYIRANPSLAAIYGYDSPEQLMVELTDISQQLYVNPQRRQEFVHLLETNNVVSDFESQIYRRDGSIIWISEFARGVRDATGKLIYYEGSVIDITQRKRSEEQLRYHACHDSLTGLVNRDRFMEKLDEAIKACQTETTSGLAVLFLDLDRFKYVNDSLGHYMGDRLLQELSHRLRNCVGKNDTLARFGGDEFTILATEIYDLRQAIAIAICIQETLNHPLMVEGHEVFARASIGITCTVGQTCSLVSRPEDFLREADTALYYAKNQGKSKYAVFTETMRVAAMRRLQLENDLRRALANQEFQLYYQPIVELESDRIVGFEALLRWQNLQQEWISPAEFVPVAEEMGLIESLGEWVLHEACQQLYQWQQYDASLTMSINLSSKQLMPDLVDCVDEILKATAIAGQSLKLEITETALMADVERAIAILNKLKERQISLSIDDFGTGYCSLNYLHRFPLDVVKIDRSFVSAIDTHSQHAKILPAIVSLTHSLQMQAIAEGIESRSQVRQLQKLQCRYGQGYLFYKPMPTDAIEKLLAARIAKDS